MGPSEGGWWRLGAPEEEAEGQPCPRPLSLDAPGFSPMVLRGEGRGDPGGWPSLAVSTG